ncbi:head-tail adaptor protein [Shimia ponticola]|uniref:head-tail adaptor protein n=1 Tax=Shimia ponticola TaxID=2582893 RepID=UPI0011BE37A4|nr:head-tail adaptor protein [Shimia ponticola]
MSQPKLNRILSLEERVRTPDGAGGFSETWQPLGMMWAQLRAGSGREFGVDFATLSRVPFKITVRAAPYGAASRPKADQRFRDGTRIFSILAVTEADASGHYLICNAVEEEAA